MVSGTLKIGQLISWNVVFDIVAEEGDWFIYYYAPDGVSMYKIRLDAASKAALKAKRDQITTFCDQDITLSGDVMETWKKETVTHPSTQTEEWVKQ
jgi:hypothetical protein